MKRLAKYALLLVGIVTFVPAIPFIAVLALMDTLGWLDF